MIRIVLADDEALLRGALAALLPMKGEIEVVAEAADGAAATAATLLHSPDVLVIDLEMPGTDGLEAVRRVLAERPEQAVLMLTRHARPGVLRQALQAGVRGFISKSARPEQIAMVVETLHRGRRWIDPEISALAVAGDSPLTDRELDVLQGTLDGLSVIEIAQRLHLAEGTVRNYLSGAMQKTQSPNRRAAAQYARERNWL